jgi:hypothetical protein
MTKLAIAGTAALLALAAPLPVLAQAAVGEPGMVSFYHPNADILHTGEGGYAMALLRPTRRRTRPTPIWADRLSKRPIRIRERTGRCITAAAFRHIEMR